MRTQYVVGDVREHIPSPNKVLLIPHIVNDEVVMGSGLAAALFKKWPQVRADYLLWAETYGQELYEGKHSKKPFKLGRNQYVTVEVGPPTIVVVNMVAQSDCGGYKDFAPIRYQSLEECLLRMRDGLQSKVGKFEIATGLIGSGLAGGSWHQITGIVRKVFDQTDVDWTWCCMTEQEMKEAEEKDWNNTKTAPNMLKFPETTGICIS
jgi:O-acetyl-ADP-ribose deacetylase (regulator of RNase III)